MQQNLISRRIRSLMCSRGGSHSTSALIINSRTAVLFYREGERLAKTEYRVCVARNTFIDGVLWENYNEVRRCIEVLPWRLQAQLNALCRRQRCPEQNTGRLRFSLRGYGRVENVVQSLQKGGRKGRRRLISARRRKNDFRR